MVLTMENLKLVLTMENPILASISLQESIVMHELIMLGVTHNVGYTMGKPFHGLLCILSNLPKL